jgi:hypothetical protein
MLLVGIFLIGVGMWVVHEVVTSKFLSKRERITVGVYDDIPYVFSYDKAARLGTVIYFNPDVLVTVPGGYSWYRLGSVQLLATIEHKTNFLLTQTFSQLIGAPVDLALYKTSTEVIYGRDTDFLEYFMSNRGLKTLFSKKYALSSGNLIDRFLINRALNASPDRLIVVNAENDYIQRGSKLYYTPERLDSQNKGYFYQKTFSENSVKVRLNVPRKQYVAGLEISRLIEGMGIKVLSVEADLNGQKECSIRHSKENKKVAEQLHNYFPCTLIYSPDQGIVIDFQLSEDLAKLYL